MFIRYYNNQDFIHEEIVIIYFQRMLNQNSKRELLIHQLSTLLSDELIQDEIPTELRQQAMAIINRSQVSYDDKQNLCTPDRFSLTKVNKSVSVKKISASPNKCLNIDQSYTSKTPKKSFKDSKKINRMFQSNPRQDTSPKYVKLYATNQNIQKYGYESQKIKQAFAKIRDIEDQKAFLQEKVQQIKHLIHEEKLKIDGLKIKSQSINHNSVSLQKKSATMSHNIIYKKRILENVEEQQKSVNTQFNSIIKQNQQVKSIIKEEKQLIAMYEVVIQELKKQIKNQTKSKTTFQQELSTSKNILEKAKQNYELLYKKTENLINKLDKDLKGILL